MRQLIAALCLGLFFITVGYSKDLQVDGRVSKVSTTIADSITYSVTIRGVPMQATLHGPWDAPWKPPVTLLQSEAPQQVGGEVHWKGIIAVIDTGEVVVPAFTVLAIVGTDTYSGSTRPIPLSIKSTIQATDTAGLDSLLAPDKTQKTLPPSWQEWLLWIGTPIALAGAYYGFRKYRAYRLSLLPPPPPPPPPTPEKVAFERLGIIRTEAKWQLDDIKGFSSDLTDTLKEYIEHRFNFNALESTTSDLSTTEVKQLLGDQEHGNLIRLLNISDEVKFARGELASTRCVDGIHEAEQLVGIWGVRWQQQQDAARIAALSETATTAETTSSPASTNQPAQPSGANSRTLLDELRERPPESMS